MNQVKVGLFIFIGLFVMISSIFILGSNKSLFKDSARLISFFDSVQGLNTGSVVSLAGVRVGNVEKIDFDEAKNLVRVIFMVDQGFLGKIKSDSKIELRTQGALGDKFLYITPGTTGNFVADNTEIRAEYGNDILSIINKRGSESEKLFDAITDFQKLIAGLNAQNKIPSLISKLDQAAGNLNESSALIKNTLASGKIDQSISKMEKIMTKIDSGQGTLGALINDRSIHDRLKSILGAGQKQQQVKSILKSSIEE
jgi:phospholipid/cholesterol/gamma-HCH transport system substrate-binding protein